METITVMKPTECTEAERQNFFSFIVAGREVTEQGLKERIKKAEALVFLKQDNVLKGIAAVKKPESSYQRRVFKKACATAQPGDFLFELGWVFVHPSSRGFGFSHKLVKAALGKFSQGIFATSRSDNTLMHKTLKTHGFLSHGKAYTSTIGNHKLILFIRPFI